MKKFLITLILIIIVGTISFVSYLVLSYTILIRTPILIKQDPIITYFLGQAQYRETAGESWKKAKIGLHLAEGYEVKTGRQSAMDIRMHDNTAIRLGANTQITIDRLNIRKLSFKVLQGSMFGKFEKLYKNHVIEIKTPTSIAAIRGTELSVSTKKIEQKNDDTKDLSIQNDKYSTTVSSLSGIISVYNPSFWNETLLLPTQHKVTIDTDSPPLNPDRMSDREINHLQSMMNAIHEEPVFLISEKIYFAVNSATILKSSNKELDLIATQIKNSNVKLLRIDGHTDSDGSAHMNQTLSIARAKSIKKYLVNKGIEENKLTISGYGESKPIADNSTEKGKAKNRRVEFIIVE